MTAISGSIYPLSSTTLQAAATVNITATRSSLKPIHLFAM